MGPPMARGSGGRQPTAGDAEDTHDSDDGGVDGQCRVHLNLLQGDAHDGQQDDGQVQLVPPGWVGRQGSARASASSPAPPALWSPRSPLPVPWERLVSPRAPLLSTIPSAGLWPWHPPAPPHTPVLEEPPEPKGHQLQHGLHDKDDGEHVIAVLEGLVQSLRVSTRLLNTRLPAALPAPLTWAPSPAHRQACYWMQVCASLGRPAWPDPCSILRTTLSWRNLLLGTQAPGPAWTRPTHSSEQEPARQTGAQLQLRSQRLSAVLGGGGVPSLMK